MCGVAGIVGAVDQVAGRIEAMVARQGHRGPDARGSWADPRGLCQLGHDRLAIIDLSPAGRQPMASPDDRWHLVFNGEVYNYRELRAELADWTFETRTDTEVILAAWARWGEACLDRFVGMFAFLIWDSVERRLSAVRDRFGVKPLYWATGPGGTCFFASEIKALQAVGLGLVPDASSWATYLATGALDHAQNTFWEGVFALPPGHRLVWSDARTEIVCWYALPDRIGPEHDPRPLEVVADEYRALLEESVRLRFRADVPVGINLSGGLDSSTLLGAVRAVQRDGSDVKAFTFVTGDPAYDELPWVERTLRHTRHPSVLAPLTPGDVPALAESVAAFQDEPFGGLPTLAYARLFEVARASGVVVLLDGQGMDEQWAGYDYYMGGDGPSASLVQGVRGPITRPACLTPGFRALGRTFVPPRAFGSDTLRNLQWRDLRFTKLPRALRFSDRVSMRVSTELREPFLDHRLVELAFRQPAQRKVHGGQTKWLLRRITESMLPEGVVEAPKRPLQTPQREWLRGPLKGWAEACIEEALTAFGGSWLDVAATRAAWRHYESVGEESSFHVWQWVNLGLVARERVHSRAPLADVADRAVRRPL